MNAAATLHALNTFTCRRHLASRRHYACPCFRNHARPCMNAAATLHDSAPSHAAATLHDSAPLHAAATLHAPATLQAAATLHAMNTLHAATTLHAQNT